MKRRQYLGIVGAGSVASVAGCLGFGTEEQPTGPPPVLDDRPNAVYRPTHVEGMKMIGMQSVDGLKLALSYSYPHRFWNVTGDRRNKVEVQDDHTVHLMLSVWDEASETAIPASNARVSATTGNTQVINGKPMWTMLSQNMGVHFGDNVDLEEGDGTYEIDVQFGPLGIRRSGDFADRFGSQITRSYDFEFSESALNEISVENLADPGGRAAVEPMQMEMMPVPQAPVPADLPGDVLGIGTTGDAKLVATVLDEPPAGIDGDGAYLAISARTPYNRYVIPRWSFNASIDRNGTSVFEDTLTKTLDPALKYHYGATVESLESGDTVTVTPTTPATVRRHEGYEMAFFSTEPVVFTV